MHVEEEEVERLYEQHEQDFCQQSCSRTGEPELDPHAPFYFLATIQTNMNQTNKLVTIQ